MDLTQEEIEKVFKRQVFLCKGLGRSKMLSIINEEFKNELEESFYKEGSHCKKPEGYESCKFKRKESWVCIILRNCEYVRK